MNDITALAQHIPERKRHDWSQSVMRDCDFCNQWALTVKHEDGARICASCCDAEYTSKLEVANAALVEALEARDKQIADKNLELFKQSADIAELALSRKNAWKQASAARNGFDEQYALREDAEKRIAELERYAEAEATGADKVAESSVYWMKRYRELESRTVTMPKLYGVDFCDRIVPDSRNGFLFYSEQVVDALAAAGIQVIEGDA